MNDTDRYAAELRRKVDALLALAETNFPGDTTVTLRVEGESGGHVKMLAMDLRKMLRGSKP